MASNVFPYGKFDLKTRKEKGSRILNKFPHFYAKKVLCGATSCHCKLKNKKENILMQVRYNL